jgi:hypothetical protein
MLKSTKYVMNYNGVYLDKLQHTYAIDKDQLEKIRLVRKICDDLDCDMESCIEYLTYEKLAKTLRDLSVDEVRNTVEPQVKEIVEHLKMIKKRKDAFVLSILTEPEEEP